jgi:phosphopentomutase
LPHTRIRTRAWSKHNSLLSGFFESLSPEYSAIVQSDHGGDDRDHRTDSDENMTIPWMAMGQIIKKGYTIQFQMSLPDTAPTITRILGISPHRDWEGHVVDEIFQ